MMHVFAMTLLFPAMCVFVVAALGRFRLIVDIQALLVAIQIAYVVAILPGAIVAMSDYLLSTRGVRFRFLYGALIAAVLLPIAAMSVYPGSPAFFWSNTAFYAGIGAAAAVLCSLLVGGVRSCFGRP